MLNAPNKRLMALLIFLIRYVGYMTPIICFHTTGIKSTIVTGFQRVMLLLICLPVPMKHWKKSVYQWGI